MSNQAAPRRRLPKVEFRVLIAGRANAGKTSILQRVCDTTKSPETYRIVDGKRTKIQLNPTSDRGEHEITDELVFSKHDGYVFHDSCGLENGSKKELETLQEFVREHSQKQKLREQLHVIWYCIPMDDCRPSLNIEPLHALRLDKNVPVIAVFTKCDAFRRNTRIDLEDDEEKAGGDLDRLTDQECQEIFQRECLDKIEDTPFVCLKGMNDPSAHCEELIQATADALNSGAVTLMLLAVQTKNLELSVQFAVQKSLEVLHVKPAVLMGVRKSGLFGKLAGLGSHMTKFVKSGTKASAPGLSRSSQLEDVVKRCLQGFPGLWWFFDDADDPAMALVQSLLSFAQQHQNHAGQDNNSHLFLLIALIIVLRYATITFINTKISQEAALNGAYQQYSAFNVPSKTAEWVAVSTTRTTEDIVAFINSIPWDMNTAQ